MSACVSVPYREKTSPPPKNSFSIGDRITGLFPFMARRSFCSSVNMLLNNDTIPLSIHLSVHLIATTMFVEVFENANEFLVFHIKKVETQNDLVGFYLPNYIIHLFD